MLRSLAILGHYVQARRNFLRWQDPSALQRWQEKKVQAHLAWVRRWSPYYAEQFGSTALTDWRQFPLQNKTSLMANFDRWNTVGISFSDAWETATLAERTRDFTRTLNGVTVGLSSGTSGSRGLFLASPAERNRWAGVLLARCLRGTLAQRHRAALFLRADSTLYQSIGSRRISFTFFDLLQPMASHVARLRELRPTLLAAPPAVLLALARQPDAAEFLAPPCILLSVADVLDDAEKQEIEHGFQVKLGQLYQATEGFLAATCSHGNLHWNEDAIVVQKDWLDESHYLPIITDFRRVTQPIIRYQLDDVIQAPVQSQCPCGSVFGLLGAISGRKDDVLQLISTDGSQVDIFPDFVRRSIVMAVASGVEYRVRQRTIDSWEIALSNDDARVAVEREISLLCQSLHAQPPEIHFIPWVAEPLIHKQRRVQCLL